MRGAIDVELLAPATALLLVALAWLALRLRRLDREVAHLARARREEAAARQRAVARAAWLDMVLEALDDGVLLADHEHRVVHWNARFAALSGLPEDMPRDGATLASLLRLSAEAGEFGLVDVDQEVARQLALLARGPAVFPQLRHRPDGAVVEFRLQALEGGALLLRCSDVTARQRPSAPAPGTIPKAEPERAAPAAPPAAAPARPPAPPAPSVPPRARRCLVLLVEDMVVNQVVTATQLRREGHRVDIAASGAEALHLAARTPYDVVLMDLMMPGMSGYQAAQGLRALPGPAGRVPIYALTAHTSEEDRARCLAAGMQGMLSKPLPAAALREVVRSDPAPTTPHADAPAPGGLPDDAVPPAGLLSESRLAELRADLPAATLARLCHQCIDDMQARLLQLDAALAEGDTDAAEREAHALAGMAGSYGLARIEHIARAVLAVARRRDIAESRAAAAGAAESFANSRAALLAWLSAA